MRSVALAVVCLCLVGGLGIGCTGPRGVAGHAGSDCTVTSTDGGGRIVTCGDGGTFSLPGGDAGVCTVTAAPDGGPRTITCQDGLGDGQHGQPGTSCTVATGDAGIKTITCADGTSVDLARPPGSPGAARARRQLPGVVLEIVSLAGGTARAKVPDRDTVSVRFTVRTRAGPTCADGGRQRRDLDRGSHVPLSRVLPVPRSAEPGRREDVSTRNSDGSYTYRFASPCPTYTDHRFTTPRSSRRRADRTALQHGTTPSLCGCSDYTVGATSYRDVVPDARFSPRRGPVISHARWSRSATAIGARDGAGSGGTYRDTDLCVTCHTWGPKTATAPIRERHAGDHRAR